MSTGISRVISSDERSALASAPDERLVQECLGGNEEAWSALIHRYKRLIYSVAFKYHTTADDAADIFQAVCIELFTELANLRKVESLRYWLITVTTCKSYHWKKQQRVGDVELDGMETEQADATASSGEMPPWLEQIENEQIVREAVGKLSGRCAEMVRLLFYQDPPLAYTDVAARLGLATGSIGFTRARCLKKLEAHLLELGF
jgi:RNA polymerase sigma factor (sigma-70 family)